MLLKKVKIENLRSYENAEIIFPRGSTLLSGDIGSGKTTILLAIEFALFGLQPSQKGTSLLRNDKEIGRVRLEFEIEDKNVIIERTLKRGKKSVTQDYSSIIIDNEKFEGSVTEIKSKVLTLLNYPREFAKKTNLLYKFTVYTPQEEMKQIILEPGDLRLNTLRHVFGIDKYKRIEENTTLLTSKLREKIRINEGMIYDLEDAKKLLKNNIEDLAQIKGVQKSVAEDFSKALLNREKVEKAAKDIEDRINEKKIIENEKSKSNVLIMEKNQQIKTITNSKNSLFAQIEEAKKVTFNENEFKLNIERLTFQEKKYDELQKEYVEVIGKLRSFESRKKETENLKTKITNLEKCPTCLQEVTEIYKNNILSNTDSELNSIKINHNNFIIKKNQLIEKIENIKKVIEDLKKKKSEFELIKIKHENIKDKENRVVEYDKQKESINNDIKMLEKHVKTLDKTISEYSEFDKIYETKQKELTTAKENENSCAIKKAEINKDVQFLETRVKEKKADIEKKESIKTKTEKIRELEFWISKKFLDLVLFTEKQVMITLKEEFSKLFSKWFSILVSESLSAKLDDDFTPLIEQQDYELDYEFLSGGERTAIALAYRLSLNQVLNSLMSHLKTRNLVILDEPTDGFSAQQLDKMRDVLHQLKVEQLIMVSHEQKIEGFVDNIVRIRKEHGITRIDEN